MSVLPPSSAAVKAVSKAPAALPQNTWPTNASALRPALQAQRQYLGPRGSRIALYVSRDSNPMRDTAAPLVLMHSVSVGASAADMRPVFDRFAGSRPVVALELPGFGSSDRGDQHYTPDGMAQALLATLAWLRSIGYSQPADVMAVSLSCEFATLAALAEPESFRSLALISPTGVESWRQETYAGGRTRDTPWLGRMLAVPLIGQAVFSVLSTKTIMRMELQRLWGSKDIDERLLDYSHRSAQEPEAGPAVLAFLRGALCTRGVTQLYRRLELPVWVAHGVRGASANCGGLDRDAQAPWCTHDTFTSGSMPYFEQPRLFFDHYDTFMRSARQPLGMAVAAA